MQKRKVRAEKDLLNQDEPGKEVLPSRPSEVPSPDSPEELVNMYRNKGKDQKKLLYTVIFFYEWCKSCGICSALCPQKIILQDETGKPSIEAMDNCIGCRFCEVHCPDFAITVKERFPDRRRKNSGSK
ncbi:MAG: hypothetical protein Q8R88_02045 [Desulfoprunum sp.]|nr:hypothetical protein [Desulfoprunum sp.]